MTYRDVSIDYLTHRALYVCSQDGDLVLDAEQHDAHHKYLQGYFRPKHDFDSEPESEPTDTPESDSDRRLTAVLAEQIEQLKTRLETQRIELESVANTHRQDVALRERLEAKVRAADEIVSRLDQAAEIKTNHEHVNGMCEQTYRLFTNMQDPVLSRLVNSYQELPGRKT